MESISQLRHLVFTVGTLLIALLYNYSTSTSPFRLLDEFILLAPAVYSTCTYFLLLFIMLKPIRRVSLRARLCLGDTQRYRCRFLPIDTLTRHTLCKHSHPTQEKRSALLVDTMHTPSGDLNPRAPHVHIRFMQAVSIWRLRRMLIGQLPVDGPLSNGRFQNASLWDASEVF